MGRPRERAMDGMTPAPDRRRHAPKIPAVPAGSARARMSHAVMKSGAGIHWPC